MKKIKEIVKNSRVLNILPRFIYSTQYYNYRYRQILKWIFASNEDTNFTYGLTSKNKLEVSHALSLITGESVQKILEYLEEIESNASIRKHISSITKLHKDSNADLNVEYGRRIYWYALVRILKPKLVLETGLDKGLGGILLCEGILKNLKEGYSGNYIGIDINPEAGYLLTGKYAEISKILYGDAIKSINQLTKKFDFCVSDSDHSEDYEYREYFAMLSKLSPNGIIVGDNSHCSDKLAKFSLAQDRPFIYLNEEPLNHWYPGGGLGISLPKLKK
jgi:predicted O-methyltransferase YrrM